MNDLARILFAAVMGASVTAALLVVATIARGARGAALPAVTALGLGAWLAVAVVAAAGGSHLPAAGPSLGLALCALWLGTPALRRAWDGASMPALVSLQALRVLGGARLLAVAGGWLPGAYGTPSGAADVALAAAAPVLAVAWSRDARWARGATLAWSAAGLATTAAGLVAQARLVRPTPGFEALWSAFLTPLLAALLLVAAYRALRARA